MVGRLDPFFWDNARQCESNAGSTIEPSRRGLSRQFFAEVGRKVIAIPRKQIVRRALKRTRNLPDDGIDLCVCEFRNALDNLGAPCTAWGLLTGSEIGLSNDFSSRNGIHYRV